MKAVYSFYSAPYAGDPAKNPGYWSRPGIEFLIWAWSVLKTRDWASQVELVTDTFGARLFEELQVPFDKVTVALDDVEPEGGKLWAIGKLKTYSLQDEPFVHLDGDAWFHTPPPAEVLAHPVACQSKEGVGPGSAYHTTLRKVLQDTDDVEPYRLFHAIGPRAAVAGCTSVYVCNDLDFNERYWQQARAFYEAYIVPRRGDFEVFHDWNMFVEQLIFGELRFQTEGVEPVYLIPEEELRQGNNSIGFCHVWGAKCKGTHRLRSLGRLRAEQPDLFWRIAERFQLERLADKKVASA